MWDNTSPPLSRQRRSRKLARGQRPPMINNQCKSAISVTVAYGTSEGIVIRCLTARKNSDATTIKNCRLFALLETASKKHRNTGHSAWWISRLINVYEVAQTVAKRVECVQIQMRSQIMDWLDLKSILSFLSAFEFAWDTNGVHEGAVLQLLHIFKEPLATSLLNAQAALSSKWHECGKENRGTTYCEALNYLLEKYATNGVITKADANEMWISKPSNK